MHGASPDITVHRPTFAAPPDVSPAKVHPHCGGRCSKPRDARGGAAHPTTPTTSRPRSGSVGTARACSVARKLLKRSYHTLRELGEEALQPA